jgi:hypothetical protein
MIPTRPLQILSTAVLATCGIVALFAPEVLLSAISMANVVPHWPMQLLAAAWLALAIFDWMTMGFTMGGIYGRPVVMTNFTHYFVAALSSLRPALATGNAGPIGVTLIFGIFAVAYGMLLFSSPARTGTAAESSRAS